MKTIWKYKINYVVTELEIPKNAEVLSVQTQKEAPYIWVLVDPCNEKES